MAIHTIDDLKMRQALPLDVKVRMTQQRIREWINEFGVEGVYVSFSGGKDSTVLLHLVREMFPDVPAVFVDTGLEYPEIREFVRGFENVEWLKPKMNFKQVIQRYGYPIISKEIAQSCYDVLKEAEIRGCDKRETPLWNRIFNPESDYAKKYPSFSRNRYDFLLDAPFCVSHKCCDIMKKKPSKEYEKHTNRHPFLATMATESRLRMNRWLQDGCNAFDVKRPTSKPMSFWTEQDVLKYIKGNNIQIASVYGEIVTDEGEELAGQMDIADFGLTNDIRPLKTTGCKRTGCMFCMFGCSNPNWINFTRMKETHPKQYEYIMKPTAQGGLGYKEIIDWINENGNLHIKY